MKVMNTRQTLLARRIDPVWKLLARTSARSLPSEPREVRTILVVDLHLVGDMVMLVPLLRSIRRRYPSARITLLAGPWAASVITAEHVVDDIIAYSAPWVKVQPRLQSLEQFNALLTILRQCTWDIGIDVRGDIRQILLIYLARCARRVGFDFTGGSALLTDIVPDDGSLTHILCHHERLASKLGAWDGKRFMPILTLTPIEELEAQNYRPFIGFHFGASLTLRRLPPNDAANLLKLHSASSEPLVMFCPSDLEDYTKTVLELLPAELIARLEIWRGSLREFIVKVSRAQRMFTMDSGPAHIAAALGRETIVFFGPNLPKYTAPRSDHVKIIEIEGMVCRPCDQRHCTNRRRQACMVDLVEVWRERSIAASVGPDRCA